MDCGRVEQVSELEAFLGREHELVHFHSVRPVDEIEFVQFGRELFVVVLVEPGVQNEQVFIENPYFLEILLRLLKV